MAKLVEYLLVLLIIWLIIIAFLYKDWVSPLCGLLIGSVVCIAISLVWILDYVFYFLWLVLFYKSVFVYKDWFILSLGSPILFIGWAGLKVLSC